MDGRLANMLFDSHAHLNDSRFDEDRQDIISSLKTNNVGRILECASSMSNLESVKKLSQEDDIFAAYGVHPHAASEVANTGYLEVLRKYLNCEKAVAVGEIGLDYYYDNSPREVQKLVLKEQLDLAQELDLPVVLHVRDAYGDALDILREYAQNGTRGVLHRYSGSAELAVEFAKMGYYLGFGGTITYKNARKTLESAEVVPINKILIETDCPYLAPVPMRSKRNEPKYVRFPCQKLATIKRVSFDEMAKITYDNACKLFGV